MIEEIKICELIKLFSAFLQIKNSIRDIKKGKFREVCFENLIENFSYTFHNGREGDFILF